MGVCINGSYLIYFLITLLTIILWSNSLRLYQYSYLIQFFFFKSLYHQLYHDNFSKIITIRKRAVNFMRDDTSLTPYPYSKIRSHLFRSFIPFFFFFLLTDSTERSKKRIKSTFLYKYALPLITSFCTVDLLSIDDIR